MTYLEMFKMGGKRFLRGAVAGAVASMVVILPNQSQSLTDIKTWTVSLSIAGIVGAITGGLMALDKLFRAE